MAKKPTKKRDDRFVVESELTIYQALELRDLMLAALAQTDDLEIDLGSVSEIDGAGLQLMMALKQEATRQGKAIRFTGHTAEVVEVLELCDLGGFFGDPVVLPSQVH